VLIIGLHHSLVLGLFFWSLYGIMIMLIEGIFFISRLIYYSATN
jgi:hypothetical protein